MVVVVAALVLLVVALVLEVVLVVQLVIALVASSIFGLKCGGLDLVVRLVCGVASNIGRPICIHHVEIGGT